MPQAAKKLLLVKPKARNWASNVTPSDSKWLQSFKNEFTWHMLTIDMFFRLFLLRFVFHQVKAPLDPGFSPLILAKQKYMEAAKDCKARTAKGVVELTSLVKSMDLIIVAFNTRLAALTTCACLEPQDKLTWALPRADGCGSYTLPVFADGTREARASAYLAGQSRSSDWLVQTHCKSWWILWIEKSWKVSRSITMESSITMDRVSWTCLLFYVILRASACRQAFWSRRWFGSAAPEVLSSMAHQRCASSSRSAFLQAQDHLKSLGSSEIIKRNLIQDTSRCGGFLHVLDHFNSFQLMNFNSFHPFYSKNCLVTWKLMLAPIFLLIHWLCVLWSL